MQVHTLPLGAYQTNCYVLQNGERCAVIDPGYEPERILSFLEEKGLTPEAVLLTHGHFDHVGAVEALVEATGCRLWMHQRDWSQKRNPINAYFYPIANCDFTEVWFCEEGEVISAAGLEITVMETPGHTWGSVCYRCGDALFSGDTLFAGGCGRTDLPGGDWATIHESLRRLVAMPENLTVYPGHGEATTLEYERKYNPYVK